MKQDFDTAMGQGTADEIMKVLYEGTLERVADGVFYCSEATRFIFASYTRKQTQRMPCTLWWWNQCILFSYVTPKRKAYDHNS